MYLSSLTLHYTFRILHDQSN